MTPSQLAQATGATPDRAARWLPHISAAMAEFGIDTPARKAMFLAQIGHESGGLFYTQEVWGPTPVQLRYEGRADLGNTQPGDGFNCRGWGLIQTTGRYNLEAVGAALGIDVINNPEARKDQANIARSSAWYWQKHDLNRFADAGDNVGCTRRINGGLNGLDDRNRRWAAAKLALIGVVDEAQALPTPTPPAAPAPSFIGFLLGLLKLFGGKKP